MADNRPGVITPKKVLRYIKNQSISVSNKIISPIEKSIAPRKDTFLFPPIFIIGAPRSGSTLFYQTLANAFKFGHFTNLHSKCYGFSYIMQTLIGRWLPEACSPYNSKHGCSDGLFSPSECGQFWYRWFRSRPQYVPIGEVDMQKLRSLRSVLIGLTGAFGLPLLFKNMHCTLRLQPLSKLLPEARFIFIIRNPLWMTQSLLLVRQRVYGDKHIWWSMEPPEIESLRDLSPEEQVVRQVDSIHRLVQREKKAIGKERFLEIRYEDFCKDVHSTLEKVRLFASQDSFNLSPRFQVPKTFSISESIRLPQDEFNKLRVLVDRISPYGADI